MPRSAIAALAPLAVVVTFPASGQPPLSNASQPKQLASNPNEKICEDIAVAGSRVATKRFCGTRAEWEEKKRQDQQDIQEMQRPMQCSVMNGHHC